MTKSRSLNLFDCVCIIVGVIIGSGIYRTTPLIASSSGSSAVALGIWLLGGLIVINGAFCYAELVTTHPRRGGDYAFLNMAYGRWLGFLFAWTEFWIIRPANVGAMAFVYAEYAQTLWGWGEHGLLMHAGAAVAGLTLLNLLGFRSAAWTQNLLSVLKVAGLLLLMLAAVFFTGAPPAESVQTTAPSFAAFKLALILVLFTYGGWNDISYVAAEVNEPRKNLPRALIMGAGLVVLIYLLVNLAFVKVLGYDGVARSQAVAAEVMTKCVGPWGGRAISLLICVSCLGAISAMIFTGSRIYHALGVDYSAVRWLGNWSQRGVPVAAVLSQAAAILTLIFLLGRDSDGFERLAVFAAPFFWLFFSLVSVSLFVFRLRDSSGKQRPFSAPVYPLGPILFIGSCVFMFYASGTYLIYDKLLKEGMAFQGIWTVAVLGSGVLFWFGTSTVRRGSTESDTDNAPPST